MSGASGVGSHPGDDQHAYDEALRLVLGELAGSGIPYVPEVPDRGATAHMVGRSLALLDSLGADLQPAGWRLTGSSTPGLDQRRADPRQAGAGLLADVVAPDGTVRGRGGGARDAHVVADAQRPRVAHDRLPGPAAGDRLSSAHGETVPPGPGR